MSASPARSTLAVLRALAGREAWDALEGDLEERYTSIAHRCGQDAAAAWLRRETLRSVAPLARERCRAAYAAHDIVRVVFAASFGYFVFALGTVAAAAFSQRPAAMPPFSLAAGAAMYSPLGFAGAVFVFVVAGGAAAIACGRGAVRSAALVALTVALVGIATRAGGMFGECGWRLALPLPFLLLGCVTVTSLRTLARR